jgi:hypothetical protein
MAATASIDAIEWLGRPDREFPSLRRCRRADRCSAPTQSNRPCARPRSRGSYVR